MLVGRLLVNVLDTWKGRLHAAEAVLDAQPGEVGERVVRKTLASLIDALRGCIDRLELTAHELANVSDSAKALERQSQLFFRSLPIASLTTSRLCEIVAVNPRAGLLLNTSTRRLIGKSLLLFLEDRVTCLATLDELREPGATVRLPITLRPRERARKQVLSCVARLDDNMLQWFLLPDGQDA